jgi:exopolysaccharide/PEP-CTERM locus tyrosine autokinase
MSNDKNKPSRATISLIVEAGSAENTDDFVVNQDSAAIKAEHVEQSDDAEHYESPLTVNILDRLRDANMLVPDSDLEPSFQDDYRKIKRPLLSNAFGRSASLVDRGNLILTSSSIPGEGKSYTAVNLALSIAQEKDITVMLVDCDSAKRGVSKLLGMAKYDGLVDVLESDTLDIGDVLLHTDVPGLRLIPSGGHHDYVNELLASHRMISLVEEITQRYDDRIIIFDGPPLLATPQAQVLAGLVGQIVFVVEAGKTAQALVEEAIGLLPEEKAIGLVLNKHEGMAGRTGYYYGYYDYED